MIPDVTLSNSISWDPVSGATKYEVRVLNSTSALVFPDPASGFYDNDVSTQFALDQALAGQPLGEYTFQVRAREPATALSSLVINYIGLSAPQNLQVI